MMPLVHLISPQFLCLFDQSRISSTDTTWLQGDKVVLGLNSFQIMSCSLHDLHIQILQSNLVQSVADFHNRDLGFVAASPLCIIGDMPSSATSSIVSDLLGDKTKYKVSSLFKLASAALAFAFIWVLLSSVPYIGLFEELKHALGGVLSIF